MAYLQVITLTLVTFALFISPSKQAVETNCVGQLDLIFMVDASNSMEDRNFRIQMDSLRALTNQLDIRPNAVKVGSIVFSRTVSSAPLSGNKQEVLNGISRFEYLDESTRTDLGLDEAMRLFRAAPRNATVPKLLMVITDGASTMPDRTRTAAYQAKEMGITIFAVGITNAINENELRELASSRSKVILTPNFENLQQVLSNAVRLACTSITIPTIPPVIPYQTQNLCAASGSMDKGIGFVPHMKSCDKYIQCYYNAATRFHLAVVRNCPLGLYFNPTTMNCDWPEKVNCRHDPCRKGCAAYPVAGSSRAYWTCEKGMSTARCCGKFQSFIPGKGCVNDSWCMEPCKIGVCHKGFCLKRPVWDKITTYHYKMDSSSKSWIPGFCKFNALDMVTCDCTYDPEHYCEADFTTTFRTSNTNSDFLMTSGLGFNSVNQGVMIGQNGRILLKTHKTMGNEPVTIKMTFMGNQPQSQDGQILLASNNNCPRAGKGSLLVIYSPDYIKAKVMDKMGHSAYVAVPTTGFNMNMAKEMILSYDNRYIALSVKAGDLQVVEKAKAPKGVMFPCGIDIGPTDKHPGFTGSVMELSLHSCTPGRFY